MKHNNKDRGKRRVQRMSEEDAAAYRQRRRGEPAQDEQTSDAEEGSRPPRTEKTQREDKSNVHVYLSPRLLNLAEELADEAKMPVKTYLAEALKAILLAQVKKYGKLDKYKSEFVSQRERKITGWKSEDQREEERAARSRSRKPDYSSGEDRPRRHDRGEGSSWEGDREDRGARKRFDKRERFDRGDDESRQRTGGKPGGRGRSFAGGGGRGGKRFGDDQSSGGGGSRKRYGQGSESGGGEGRKRYGQGSESGGGGARKRYGEGSESGGGGARKRYGQGSESGGGGARKRYGQGSASGGGGSGKRFRQGKAGGGGGKRFGQGKAGGGGGGKRFGQGKGGGKRGKP